jgi:hypothetical protein
MRTAALASLIFAAGLVTVAHAQDPAPAAAQPAAPAVTPAAPSATTPPATTAAPGATAPSAEAAAPEAPPTLPTTGDGAVLLSVIDRVCVPLVRGGNIDDLAKGMGMKKDRRSSAWSMPLGGDKAYTVTVFPLGSNKDVCRGEIHYTVNQTDEIVKAINIWAFLHQPEFILQANYVKVYDDGVKRVQRSWEHLEANASQAVNFTTLTKPDDSSLNGKFSTAEFYYQERKF